jgi:hypothetical protein
LWLVARSRISFAKSFSSPYIKKWRTTERRILVPSGTWALHDTGAGN